MSSDIEQVYKNVTACHRCKLQGAPSKRVMSKNGDNQGRLGGKVLWTTLGVALTGLRVNEVFTVDQRLPAGSQLRFGFDSANVFFLISYLPTFKNQEVSARGLESILWQNEHLRVAVVS